MKQVVYYSDYMKEKQHEKKTGKARRLCTYTMVAFLSMQCTQMYSMASFTELFEKCTNIKANIFEPERYTNVEIEEPNGSQYIMGTDGTVKNKAGEEKEAYFTNPIDNVTYEYVRARVVPVIKHKDGSEADGTAVTCTIATADKWIAHNGYYYYSKPLAPGEETTKFLTKVMITSPTREELQNKKQYIELNVVVDTIETDKDGSMEKANDAWGVKLADILG